MLGFLDVLANALKNDVLHEDLCDDWCRGDEDLGCFVAGVWSPFIGASELDDLFPVWYRWENLERLWKLAGLVSREEEADPRLLVSCCTSKKDVGECTYFV